MEGIRLQQWTTQITALLTEIYNTVPKGMTAALQREGGSCLFVAFLRKQEERNVNHKEICAS